MHTAHTHTTTGSIGTGSTFDSNAKCSKCSGTFKLQKHHVHPVTHYGREGNNLKVWLCQKCHSDLERTLLVVEEIVRGRPSEIGEKRYKLKPHDYEKLLHNFLHDRTIIYVAV